jgi:beta-mannosidase
MNQIEIKSQAVEFGSRGLAPVETIRQILPEDKQWPPDPDAWTYYNTNSAWFESMNIYPKDCSSLEELVEKVDTWYAREVKDNIELLRQKKYRPVCSMFQYFWADPWACIYGSGVYDYYRRPYGCLESYKKSYLPLLVSFEWDMDPKYMGDLKRYRPGETLKGRLWIVNDTYQSYSGTLVWSVKGPSGKDVLNGSVKASIAEDSADTFAEMAETLPKEEGLYRMEIAYTGAKGELSSNFFEFEIGG